MICLVNGHLYAADDSTSVVSVALLSLMSSIYGPFKPAALWYRRLDEKQLLATQFIDVRISLVFIFTQIENFDCRSLFICRLTHAVEPKTSVHDVGLFLYSDMLTTSHKRGLVRTSLAILRQLMSVSRSLTQDVTRRQWWPIMEKL